LSHVTPYANPETPAPAWRDVHRFWLRLMEVYAADCERAGVDHLEPNDLRYQRGHVAAFMHALIVARTAAERERIIGEAASYLESQQHGRLAAAPMKTIGEQERFSITARSASDAPHPPNR
jgi:hypothetical protein